MTSSAETAAAQGISGSEVAVFASRRTLVLRRFARNRLAVASLTLLVLLFIGCYTLPSLLPYSYDDLDFNALLQPPNSHHWLGTNAMGQDLLAQILRGMHRRHRRVHRGLLRGLAGPGADVAGRPAVGGAQLHPHRDRHTANQELVQHPAAGAAAGRLRLDDQLAHGPRHDHEPA
jgi:hypothetical protein